MFQIGDRVEGSKGTGIVFAAIPNMAYPVRVGYSDGVACCYTADGRSMESDKEPAIRKVEEVVDKART